MKHFVIMIFQRKKSPSGRVDCFLPQNETFHNSGPTSTLYDERGQELGQKLCQ